MLPTASGRRNPGSQASQTRLLGICLLSFAGTLTAHAQPAPPIPEPVATPQDYSRSTSYEYYPDSAGAKAGLLRIERVEPDHPSQCVETEHLYDVFGNKTEVISRNCAGSLPGDLFPVRRNTSGFAGYSVLVTGVPVSVPTGAFATRSTNALGHVETRVIDPRSGTAVSAKGPNDLTTRYDVDDWGRVLRETRADNTSTRSIYCLIQGRVADHSSNSAGCDTTRPLSGLPDEVPSCSDGWRAISYVQVQSFDAGGSPMGPAQRVYKDADGRAIREIAQAFDGPSQPGNSRWIVKDHVYNAYGVAVVTTGNYFLQSGGASTTGSNEQPLTATEVDALGRPVVIYQRDPQGSSTASFGSYGSHTSSRTRVLYEGLKTTTTNDLGQVRTEEKNPNGVLVRVTDATGAQLAHQHDAFGNLIATKDALQNITSLSYDKRGRRLSMNDPGKGLWLYRYNALGELVWQQSPNERATNQATTTTFDELGRIASRTTRDFDSRWVYDNCSMGNGKLCRTFTTHGVDKTFSYDALGRPRGSRVAVTDGPSFNTALSYDSKGRLDTQTYPTGFKVQYGYTSLGFLAQVSLPQAVSIVPDTAPGQAPGTTVQWAAGKVLWTAGSVNARGQSENSALANGLTSRAGFEGPTGRTRALSVGAGAATDVAHHTYEWDSVGNLKTRVDHNGDGLAGAVTDTYTYDALNRLVRYRVQAANAAHLTRTVDLHYNAIGNLLHKSDVGNYTYPDFGPGKLRPHAVSQVTLAHETRTYGYDANGNAISASAGAWRSISYTSFNMPDSQSGAQGRNGSKYTWFYDENHQRLRETRQNNQGTRTTWYLHPDNQGGLGFESESGNTSTALNRHYVSAGGQMLVVVTRQALSSYASTSQTSPPVITTLTAVKVEFWHKDHLGSLVATSDHAGSVTARYAYDPFGKRRQTTGTYDPHGALVIDWVDGSNRGTDRGFTGHEHLDDIGLVHMNGRLFDPTISRFLQADPFIQTMDELQNYNRYSYCFGNPLNCADPSGYFSFKKLLRAVVGFYLAGPVGAILMNSKTGRMVLSLAVSLYLPGAGGYLAQLGVSSTMAQAAISGFISGAISAGNLEGAIQGAFTAAVFAGVGNLVDGGNFFTGGGVANSFAIAGGRWGAVALHGVAGCVTGVAAGAKCGPSALSAAVSKAATVAGFVGPGPVAGTITSAIVGGTASVLAGGKFSNGAKTAAFGYLFNFCNRPGNCGWSAVREFGEHAWSRMLGSLGLNGTATAQGALQVSGHAFIFGLSYSESGSVDTNLQLCSAQTACLRLGPGVYLGGGSQYSLGYRPDQNPQKTGDFSVSLGLGGDIGTGTWGAGGQGVYGLTDRSFTGAKGWLGYGAGFSGGVDVCVQRVRSCTGEPAPK